MFGLEMDGYHYGNLNNLKMSENKKHCYGTIYLHDFNMNQVCYRIYGRKKKRQEILDYWTKLYKLENKDYYIVISPK
jgi:hypothetical protein